MSRVGAYSILGAYSRGALNRSITVCSFIVKVLSAVSSRVKILFDSLGCVLVRENMESISLDSSLSKIEKKCHQLFNILLLHQ